MRLKIAIERARNANVSLDSINRAIKRGTGEGGGTQLEELTYEAYGPGGTAILIKAATDNRNRTASEIRFICSKHGGRMAEVGAVAWMFEQKGIIEVNKKGMSEDDVLALAIDAGALDMMPEDDVYQVYTSPSELDSVRAKLESGGAEVVSADLTMVPKTTVTLEGEDAEKMVRLLEALDEQDDVSEVYTNFDMPEDSA